LALSTDIADWFKFTTTSAGSYTLTLIHPTLIYTFDIYSSVNNSPALIPTTTSSTTKTYTLAANSIYYISVTGSSSYLCYQFSVAPASFLTKSSESIIQNEIKKSVKKIDIFNVSAYPNPSGNYFTLKIETASNEKIDLRVMDVTGRLIEEKKNVSASDILKLGEKYINGVYIVEVAQSNKRRTVKLIKMF
jgi:hypothetical protein